MSRRSHVPPAVDLDALPDDLDADATQFIRISGPPKRPAPRPTRPAPRPPQPTYLAPPQPTFVAPPPVPPTPQTPFRVVSGPPPSSPPRQSALHAVILGCSAMLCLAMVVLTVDPFGLRESRASVDPIEPVVVAVDPVQDTGDWLEDEEDEEVVVADAQVVRPPPRELVHHVPPPPRGGDLRIRLPNPQGVTSVAVTCPSGFSGHSSYGASPHVIATVPAEACTLHFRGASPYRFHGARGGQTLTCTFSAGVASCG